MTELINTLTDIATHKLVDKDLQIAFDEIATGLLRHTKIVTPKDHFLIREIEIYFYDEANHPDPYTHKRKRQSEFGEWYFHRFTDISTFMNSKRNGLDITFGNKAENTFGGILIRKIQNINANELTIGINRVVKKLIENIGEENINEIALGVGQKVFDKTQLLHVDVDDNNYSLPIFRTQRNGLKFKENELAKKYYESGYCYYNHNLNISSQIIEVTPAV